MSLKQPKRLMGFLELDEIECPFEFDHDSYKLNIYPPSIDVWKGKSDFISFIASVNDGKKHEWVKSIKLSGITAEGNAIVFCVRDTLSNDRGFSVYDVDWYYLSRPSFPLEKIRGFRLIGQEIDYFYPPESVALEKKITFREKTKVDKLSVKSVRENGEIKCGSYTALSGLRVEAKLEAFAIMHHNVGEPPIEAKSQMVLSFSRDADYNETVEVYRQVETLLKYIVYRNNVAIDAIDTFYLTDDNLRDYAGVLVFPQANKETHTDAHKRIITAPLLGDKTAKLLSIIAKKKMGFQHICDSVDDRRHYSPGRMIMIMAEFEREYHNIYGYDHGRSDRYRDVKNDVIELIEQYRKGITGKSREYAQQIKKLIKVTDNSYSRNVSIALEDCDSIIYPFIRRKYNGAKESIKEGICNRAGEIRNGIAHSKLEFNLDAIHLADIKVMEELIYAMRLKAIGISEDNIRKSINQLFNENMAL